MSESKVRPTKKQYELLAYIDEFIQAKGYSPSYREIMNGCNYTSVATVALHVGNLIKRGHLRKRSRSARSLEVVKEVPEEQKITVRQVAASEEKWLVQKIEGFFKEIEGSANFVEADLDKLYVLIGTLKVLGLDGAAQAYIARLTALKQKLESLPTYSV